MSVDVYPTAVDRILRLEPGTASTEQAITARTAADPVTGRTMMYLRVAQAGPPDAAPPVLRLAAGAGPPVDVGATPTPVPAAGSGPAAATATVTREPHGVQLVSVEVLGSRGTGRWRLQIVNTADRACSYVWVVAGDEAATARPWIDTGDGPPVRDAVVGDPPRTTTTAVGNRGTGTLELTDPERYGRDGFTLTSITPRRVPPNANADVEVRFVPPTAPATCTWDHPLASNDTLASDDPASLHCGVLRVRYAVRARPLWDPGDVLVLLPGDRCRLARLESAAGTTTTVAELDADRSVAVDPRTGDAIVLGYSPMLTRVDRTSGEVTVLNWGGHRDARAHAVDRDGSVVVLDTSVPSTGTLLLSRYSPDGEWGPELPGGPYLTAVDVAVEDGGTVLVARDDGLGADAVTRIRPAQLTSTTLVDGGGLSPFTALLPGERAGTTAVAVGPDRSVVVLTVGPGRGSLFRVHPVTGTASHLTTRDELASGRRLAVDAGGRILVGGEYGVLAVDEVDHVTTGVVHVYPAPVTGLAVVPPVGP